MRGTMRKGYADTPMGPLHWVEVGQGAPLLLLGPTPRSWRVFAQLLPLLEDRFRVIVVEQPGTGESVSAPDATIEHVAAAVGEALGALVGAQAMVFGLHSGAKVAVALAANAPHLVSTLVLCGKSHSIAPDMELRNRATRAAVERHYFVNGAGDSSGGDTARSWQAVVRNATALLLDDDLVRASPARLDSAASKLADTLNTRDTVLAGYRANFAFDLALRAAAVTCPTTIVEIVSPAEDAAIGRQGEALARIMRDARVVTLPETDRIGIDLHAGTEAIASEILKASEAGRHVATGHRDGAAD